MALTVESEPFRRELGAFLAALPRLLAEGHERRYVVVSGTEVSDPWDTFRDGMQYGRSLYEPGRFLVQEVDSRVLPLLTVALGSDVAGAA